MHTSNNVRQSVPFFMVDNMERSLEFYCKGLGFEITRKWEPRGTIEWCWLQLGNAALMLQEYREGSRPADQRGAGVSVYFICADALVIYKQILERRLALISEPFVGNGAWVVGMKDPDGYNIYFESQTDVPEETLYSDWISK